jgi:hypothetical protein
VEILALCNQSLPRDQHSVGVDGRAFGTAFADFDQCGNALIVMMSAAAFNVVIMVKRSDLCTRVRVKQILDACLPGLCPLKEGFRGPHASAVGRLLTTKRVIQLSLRDRQQLACIGSGMGLRCWTGRWRGAAGRNHTQRQTGRGPDRRPRRSRIRFQFIESGNVDMRTRQKLPRESSTVQQWRLK